MEKRASSSTTQRRPQPQPQPQPQQQQQQQQTSATPAEQCFSLIWTMHKSVLQPHFSHREFVTIGLMVTRLQTMTSCRSKTLLAAILVLAGKAALVDRVIPASSHAPPLPPPPPTLTARVCADLADVSKTSVFRLAKRLRDGESSFRVTAELRAFCYQSFDCPTARPVSRRRRQSQPPTRENLQVTFAPQAEAVDILFTPLPSRSTPPTSPSDSSSEFSPSDQMGPRALPAGAGTEELDINSSETIMLSNEVGVEWMSDDGHLEHRVGPLLKTDRGQLDLFVTDTELMQKKRPALKSIARKLKQQRWYGPRSGGKEAVPDRHPHQPRPRVRQQAAEAGLDG
jgi:hypothetical protein